MLELERRQLVQLGRQYLSCKVRWIADENGDGDGYDVHSFAPLARNSSSR